MINATKMTPTELGAVLSLSAILSLRMIGLFMVIPVFTLYAHGLMGATPSLIGLAFGIYGLFQALCQIPFGTLSDKIGRKPIIMAGLLLFMIGSAVAGFAHSIVWMIVGRSLQGMGAIGSTTLAYMADLTREETRTKSMAIAGITIGMSFSFAMLLGPLLAKWLPVNYLFFIATALGFVALLILLIVPIAKNATWHGDAEINFSYFARLITNTTLAKLNIGIFLLHATFTASFIAIPVDLLENAGLPKNQQWELFLPTLLIALFLSLTAIGIAEAKLMIKPFFIAGIVALILAEAVLWLDPYTASLAFLGLALFFTGFTLLESFLPSLISRAAPAGTKGSAMGLYSCSQYFGIFFGGTLGGILYGKFHLTGIYVFCLALLILWLLVAKLMKPIRYLSTEMFRLSSEQQTNWPATANELERIPGVAEMSYNPEEGVAYIKVERETKKNPDFIRIKERLQSR